MRKALFGLLLAVIALLGNCGFGPAAAEPSETWYMPTCNDQYQPMCAITNETLRVDCDSPVVFCDDEGA